jgi:hypothetical protein
MILLIAPPICLDDHSVSNRRNTGSRVGDAVDGHQAVEAYAHTAEQTFMRLVWGNVLVHDMSGSHQYRRGGFTSEGLNRFTIDDDIQPRPAAVGNASWFRIFFHFIPGYFY